MANHRINIPIGTRFGRLVVVGEDQKKNGLRQIKCVCDCGNKRNATPGQLRSGKLNSCGCLYKETRVQCYKHGMVGTKTYNIWSCMKERTGNPKTNNYKHYGGRGIKLCDRWKEFKNFYEDMGICPEGYEIDRKDTNGDYTKDNCRWATRSVNKHNTRPFGKTGLKGVVSTGSTYQVMITKDGISNYVGKFKSKIEAAKAYDSKAIELYGKQACTNKSLGLI